MDITVIITKLKETMQDLFALKEDIPTKVSDLTNDLNFIMKNEVRNNLSSNDTQLPLSANQGRLLNNALNNKAANNHTHSNISDIGWQHVVFEDGFNDYGSDSPVRYRRIGKVVHLEGIIKNSTAFTPNTTAKKVAIIDDLYCRPNTTQYALMQGTDANKFLLSVSPNGMIGIARYGTNVANTQITANSWLHCFLTWIVETEDISIPTSINMDGNFVFNSNGMTGTAIVTLIDNNNNGIPNQAIQYYKDNTLISTKNTNDNGEVTFDISVNTSNNSISFVFNENAPYRGSKKKTDIT